MRALYTAATGMAAQELNVQVISNNIANMRTTGYKKQRAAFQDLIYDHVRRVGAQASDQGTILPVGVDIGGATTDVHSIASGEPCRAGVIPQGLPEPRVKRTVEGDLGMRHNIAQHCDALARLPMSDAIESLNVSNAAAIALYAIATRAAE